jgi:hypothetical protein
MASSERAPTAESTADTRAAAGTPAGEAAATARTPAGESARSGDQGEHGSASPPSGPMAATVTSLRCSCLMNARYHATREAFLDNVHRWFMFAVIVLGAGALIDIFPKGTDTEAHGSVGIKEAFAAFAAIIAALDLTFDLSNRARTHSLMKRRYFELIADLVSGEKTPEQVEACMERFNADEEPAYHALIATSYNAAQEAVYGLEAYSYKIPTAHLFCKNFWRFGGTKYEHSTKPIGRPVSA